MNNSASGKHCDKCKVFRPFDQYKTRTRDTVNGKAGELTSKCASCMKTEAEYQRQKKRKHLDDEDRHTEERQIDSDAPVVLLGSFLADLAQKAENDTAGHSAFNVGARVECSDELLKWEGEARAKKVPDLIEQSTLWHWSYVFS